MKPQTLDGLANGKTLNFICMLFIHNHIFNLNNYKYICGRSAIPFKAN